MAEPQVQVVGMAWYQESEYPRVLKAMVDGHVLPPTYREWLQAAEQGFASRHNNGVRVIKAQIKLDDFLAWCTSLNINPDSQARIRWANDAAHRAIVDGRGN